MKDIQIEIVGKILFERYSALDSVQDYLACFKLDDLCEEYVELFHIIYEDISVVHYRVDVTWRHGCPGNGGYVNDIRKIDEFYFSNNYDAGMMEIYDSLDTLLVLQECCDTFYLS